MDSRFVGRAGELAGLTARLEDALTGRSHVVLVAGEPGIGKTRLVAELARLAGARAVPVLWGGCTDEAGAPAYWPWRRILRAWLATTEPEEATARLREVGADLTPIAPELAALGTGGPAPASGPEQRFALFDAAARLLTGIAEDTGLVLALDDVQWADIPSLALLVHLAREATTARLLVAATCRAGEVAGDPARVEVLAALARLPGSARLELAGLAAPEVAAALADRLGAIPAPDVVDAVTRRTGGNPFFVGELSRMLAGGCADRARVPGAVRDVVGRRLARLPARCRELLEVAAVAGADLDLGLVAAVAGVPVEEALDGLRPAVDDGVLDRSAGAAGLRFAHDLLREALLGGLAPARRARLHRCLAEALEPGVDDPDVLAELARHALAALPVGDVAAAVRWARRAAEQAAARQAHEEAARLLVRAGEAGRGHLPAADRLELLVETARAQVLGHQVSAAIASCTAAADLARQLGDPAALGRAALVVQGVSEYAWMPVVRGWCEEALRDLPERDDPLRAQLLAQLAHAIIVGRADSLADTASEQALGMAERLDDPPSLVAALRARQLVRSGPDGVTERMGLGDRMLAVADRTGDLGVAMWGHLWRFDALLQLGRVGDAEREIDRLDPVVARLRQPLARMQQLRARAAIAYGRGAWERARRMNDEATAIAERGGHRGAAIIAQAFATLVTLETGEGEPLLEVPDVPEASLPGTELMRANAVRWHLERGRRAEALGRYATLPPPGDPRIPPFLALGLEAVRALVATELADAEAAEAAYRLLLPHADRHACGGAGAIASQGSMQLFLGVAATGCGRLNAAVRHLRAAVAVNDAAGLLPFAATARFRLAVALRARGRAGDAAEAVAAAVEADTAARRLGMAPLRARLAALAAASRDGGVLSRREAEIAELVGRGLTNRQIAAAAHISERTAEAHVQHILAKLGFSGRAQIAAWVARRAP
ncbi:ATP-binding protein [Pseudonocardia asaccharolytica]|uniref:HTH luxR-type domain-containing protein n=1 Tax=Pseudonocardia asaccharolytica DSM 44247 = NBRC 16224 TaxID=1123024 RepID=A0A511D5D9_9PSEU|nr:LuxR family transcriptional regulator [Pseudonocardia asaccharolytica]GEL20012.1 hypothetical protein PA7_38490 [Pseudonocardia asaccharolytica DSM 44247 = NBRC 16224]